MDWIIWLVVIVAIVAVVWWLLNRNSSRGRSGYFVSENAPPPPLVNLSDRGTQDGVDWKKIFNKHFRCTS